VDLFALIDQAEGRFRAWEPQVMAFVPEAGRFERLRREAGELLARFPDPAARPPLFGWLVGVKDILHVAGIVTHAGCDLPPELFAGPEAESVTRLKEAGALILGKTVTAGFGYFTPGPTRNPRNPAHTPGGSSSGSAAAVAAGLCPLALATQTIGSIIRPAAFCGVAGLKPTYGRVSRAGMFPLAASLDCVGLHAAGVGRLRRAARHLYRDWRPPSPAAARTRPILGLPEGPYLEQASPAGLEHFRRVCRRLERAGYAIRRVAAMPDFAEIRARHERIVAAEAARFHAAWFEAYPHVYTPEIADLVRLGLEVTDGELSAALEGRAQLRTQLGAWMDAHGIDLWITPAAPGPAPRGLASTGDPVMNLPWSHAGLPALTLPSGVAASGLPLGLQLAGRWSADELLLSWAEEVEQVLRG
jgi:Asp-tRNA(Asn)/Glu-tRNA(Gln) amidotransferase A subunit family amidase